ncbi:MAG: hypothetical protein JJU07_05275 [Natronohydrobacter sp.]|nr:hypothetical protein [Natronohydrobacter sp.]
MLRSVARLVLTGLMVAGLVWSGLSLWRFIQSPVGGVLVARSEAQLSAAYEHALARHATAEAIAARISARLQEMPRNWVALEGLMALAEGQELPEPVASAYAQAHAEDHSWRAMGASCGACAVDLRHCSMGADLGCGIGVNLTVAGDVLSLGRESGAWMRGEDLDALDVTLSFIGIGATGLVVATGGTSLAVKAGAGVMKVAHRMGRLSPGLRRIYTRAAREGVDWAAFGAARTTDDLARLARMEALRPALDVTEALGRVQARVGTRGALHLVGQVDTLDDARRLARASDALGPRSVGAFEVLGKSRFLRTGLRLSDTLREAIAGLMAALAAGLGLIWNRMVRRLRRAVA